VLLVVTAACGSGDDDDDNDAATATISVGSSSAQSSPTTASESEATATEADATAIATETEADEPTATSGSKATATEAIATATSTETESTATEPSGETTPSTDEGSTDVPDIETLDPELLPNFSLTMNFDATNLSGTPQTTIKMQMEQSAVDHYHLNMETDGEVVEFWTVGEQSWTSIAGEVVESPTGPMFSPADILTTGELIPEGLEAREDGSEEVNGRQTTRWVIDGADYVEYMNEQTQAEGTSTIEMSDGTGEVTVWIDDELNIMIKADGDVAWKNSDDTDGSLVYDYEIYDIDSTSEVEAPQ
jgi:hypothetical protein